MIRPTNNEAGGELERPVARSRSRTPAGPIRGRESGRIGKGTRHRYDAAQNRHIRRAALSADPRFRAAAPLAPRKPRRCARLCWISLGPNFSRRSHWRSTRSASELPRQQTYEVSARTKQLLASLSKPQRARFYLEDTVDYSRAHVHSKRRITYGVCRIRSITSICPSGRRVLRRLTAMGCRRG